MWSENQRLGVSVVVVGWSLDVVLTCSKSSKKRYNQGWRSYTLSCLCKETLVEHMIVAVHQAIKQLNDDLIHLESQKLKLNKSYQADWNIERKALNTKFWIKWSVEVAQFLNHQEAQTSPRWTYSCSYILRTLFIVTRFVA